jgi:hypothetical protein
MSNSFIFASLVGVTSMSLLGALYLFNTNSCSHIDCYRITEFDFKSCSISADTDSAGNFTFSVPCIKIQLPQFEPTNVHNFIKITLILQHTSSYMFRALLVLHQGEHNCTKLLLNIFCMQQGCQELLHVERITHWWAAENLSVCNTLDNCV